MSGYHPSLLKPETRERIIERDLSSMRKLTQGEELVIEVRAIEMVLNGNPPPTLVQQCRARLDEITRKLSELSEEEARRMTANILAAMQALDIEVPALVVVENSLP